MVKKNAYIFFTGNVVTHPERDGVQFARVLGTNTWQQYLVTLRLEPRYNDVASFPQVY